MANDFILIDNSPAVKQAMNEAILRALERCGMQAEGYAKDLAPVDTGNLRNSISHRVDESDKVVYIGTNAEYAAYVELGTGIYTEGGRQDPWVYQDEEGRWHHTRGQKPQPYLVPAVKNHGGTYRNIFEDERKNG